MSIEIRAELLKSLSGKVADTEPPARRLATRWVKGGVEKDFDIQLRLQVLEGVASKTVVMSTEIDDEGKSIRRVSKAPQQGEWAKHPRTGLKRAKQYFSGLLANGKTLAVDPDWFSPGNSGVYPIVYRCVQHEITSLKLRVVEPLDIIASGLMGLGSNLDVGKANAYSVGVAKAGKIVKGQDTPLTVAKGPLCKSFRNRVWREERKQRQVRIPVNEKGDEMVPQDPVEDPNLLSYDPDEFGEFLAEVVFRHPHDPVGSKVRDLMRAAWHDSPPMLLWLSTVEKEHRYLTPKDLAKAIQEKRRRYPTQKDVAEQSNITPSAFHQRHWKPRWKKFLQALKSRHSLLTQMEEKASEYGVYWDASFLRSVDMDSLLSPRPDRPHPRAATNNQEQIKRVASRYISTLGFS